MYNTGNFARDCALIRQRRPIILNITNYVAMNFTANALLAVGASPVMSKEPSEIEELSAAADSVVINLGCLEKDQVRSTELAAGTALSEGKPWVLDPAGAGLSAYRTDTALRLIKEFKPSVIKGNAAEILCLCGQGYAGHGLDSVLDSSEAVSAAVSLSAKTGTVVCISGKSDYITDGNMLIRIGNGSSMMSLVTALGCTASAICGAFLSVNSNSPEAAANAMSLMGLAGEKAAGNCAGPGSFVPAFLDALYNIDAKAAAESIEYEKRTA